MAKLTKHARILLFPYADSLSSAQLEGLYEEPHSKHLDFVIDYRELHLLVE